MKTWSSVDEVLEFAISEEQGAQRFYTDLAGKMTNPAMKEAFLQFAAEERGHEATLRRVQKGRMMLDAEKKVQDLGIADYMVDVTPSADMPYEEALQIAMKKEKAAYRLYTDLAGTVGDPEIRELFLGLAQEEAKHKLRFEVEYDDRVLTEN